jgi:hypothetical protein
VARAFPRARFVDTVSIKGCFALSRYTWTRPSCFAALLIAAQSRFSRLLSVRRQLRQDRVEDYLALDGSLEVETPRDQHIPSRG